MYQSNAFFSGLICRKLYKVIFQSIILMGFVFNIWFFNKFSFEQFLLIKQQNPNLYELNLLIEQQELILWNNLISQFEMEFKHSIGLIQNWSDFFFFLQLNMCLWVPSYFANSFNWHHIKNLSHCIFWYVYLKDIFPFNFNPSIEIWFIIFFLEWII